MPALERFNASVVDPTVNPCDDFHQYVCGKWMASHPIPADQRAWGTWSPLALWNDTLLAQTLEKLSAADAKRTANEQKVGDYYFACMDEAGIAAHTQGWVKQELDRIASIRSKRELATAVAHLHQTLPAAWSADDNQTNAALFGFSGGADFNDASRNVPQIDQGGMGMPGRGFYLDQDDRSKEIRAKYLLHVQNMFGLAGEVEAAAKTDAAVVLEIETALARKAMDVVARRDPKNLNNRMSLDQVKALTPSFDWPRYLALVNAPASSVYIVSAPEFFKNLETVLRERSLDQWKTYLRWRWLHGAAPRLSDAFVKENFSFFFRELSGTQELQPRWRRCVAAVDFAMGEALGQVYVDRAFPPQSKARVLQMIADIESEMQADIQRQDWMAAETKQRAVEKLHAVVNKIGYPDHWRDYSDVRIGRASYLENVGRATGFEFERWVRKINKPVDRAEWVMTPPTVDAYEDPQTNTINFPAGILQPPLFEAEKDAAVNYGATGMVIGHELIHGFDDQGRKFDALGNLKDWWQPADAASYEQRGACIAKQYTQAIPEAGVKQDGRLTQGEDTADNGGMHLAFLALLDALKREGRQMDAKEADGLTPRQRFFESYAFSWCEQVRPEFMRTQVLTNPHSLPKYRVNNVISNMPEFWEAFSCKKGDKMVSENACRVW
jgi:endothelin-converting enzyme/putative endopeptidase